jgi:hypothetical protein
MDGDAMGNLNPPVLVCGIAERVGSNWLSDTLRDALPQHNEPLRQQVTSIGAGTARPATGSWRPPIRKVRRVAVGACCYRTTNPPIMWP